ncbi:MAG: YciI family protein [Burkholderiales bacterium]
MNDTKIPKSVPLDATKGMLQKQLYVYFTKPVAGLQPVLANLDAHLEFQKDLERRGVMFGAGPFWTEDEQYCELDGMVIIRAKSIEEARAIADSDPMHRSGARSFTIRPWLMNEGTITLKIEMSTGKYQVV